MSSGQDAGGEAGRQEMNPANTVPHAIAPISVLPRECGATDDSRSSRGRQPNGKSTPALGTSQRRVPRSLRGKELSNV